MNNLSIAKQYFDAWNSHNAQAIIESFTDKGTYQDPAIGSINACDIGNYAQGLWLAFPDLFFSVINIGDTGEGNVAAQWLMTGTNTGPFMGLPPSGRSISVQGADFIQCVDDKIKSIMGYFDSKVTPSQLGMQVVVQPNQVGPFSLGNSVAVQSGKSTKPGAFSITSIWNEEQESEEIRNRSRNIATEMMEMEGFIGFATVRIGGRGVTISAWEKPENVTAIMKSKSHMEAVNRFRSDLSYAAFTSVWIPHHINPLWIRCKSCKKMNDSEKSHGLCDCGSILSDAPAYF